MASASAMIAHRSFLAALGLFAAFAAPACAQSYGDAGTGLSISPPAPFAATAGRAHPLFETTIDINSKTGQPKTAGGENRLCVLGFKRETKNAELTREQVNTLMARPEWQAQYRTLFESVGTVSDLRTFEHQGFLGIELIVLPKAEAGAQATAMFTSIMETAKGRTGLICVTEQAGLAAAVPRFRALRATMHAPE